jgi:hypothetical protein
MCAANHEVESTEDCDQDQLTRYTSRWGASRRSAEKNNLVRCVPGSRAHCGAALACAVVPVLAVHHRLDLAPMQTNVLQRATVERSQDKNSRSLGFPGPISHPSTSHGIRQTAVEETGSSSCSQSLDVGHVGLLFFWRMVLRASRVSAIRGEAERRYILGRPDLGFPPSAEKCSKKAPDDPGTFLAGGAHQILNLFSCQIGKGVTIGGGHLSIPHDDLRCHKNYVAKMAPTNDVICLQS